MSMTGEPSWASSSTTSTIPSPVASSTRTATIRTIVAAMKLGRYWLRVANTPRIGLAGLCPRMQLQVVAHCYGPVQGEQRQDAVTGFQSHQAVGKLRVHHDGGRLAAASRRMARSC